MFGADDDDGDDEVGDLSQRLAQLASSEAVDDGGLLLAHALGLTGDYRAAEAAPPPPPPPPPPLRLQSGLPYYGQGLPHPIHDAWMSAAAGGSPAGQPEGQRFAAAGAYQLCREPQRQNMAALQMWHQMREEQAHHMQQQRRLQRLRQYSDHESSGFSPHLHAPEPWQPAAPLAGLLAQPPPQYPAAFGAPPACPQPQPQLQRAAWGQPPPSNAAAGGAPLGPLYALQ